ncbi:DNA-binding protein [Candidatus Micrarchaeota archaeon]|nr:DNA-binding protein [Candidatus Micrarchaeota archaeon]
MDLVVDANIIFAALVKDGATIDLLLEPEVHLFAPEFLFEEILKHKDELLDKTRRGAEELDGIFDILEQKITIIPKEDFEPFLREASKISPDPDDVVYFALAIRIDAAIWSNDRKLKEQNRVKVYSTKDLLGKR